ncbi:MAG TPA: UDP-N-acetylmuramate--L-alanine ligase [Candidatus Dormibacteraeota bacterium]|nr:UDP-N-acetylmuramate--L-alanine ligase [Candidatus Dormibacteraeota bacterium]
MVSFRNFQRIHLVGIGGIGMSGIAEVLLTLGYSVSGSDLKLSGITSRLQNLGAAIHEGHRSENVAGAHVVVISSAVHQDNPEVIEAHREKIPVIPRAEMLAELMRLKYGIAVAGAHGKTTTTSITASILAAAHLDPTFVVGGRVNQAGTTARLGKGEYMVVEADESDRSFLLLAPVVAVVTTIDREHLDQYSSLQEIQDVFTQFVNKVPFYGAAILCLDEPNVQAIIPQVKRPVITYGTSSQADLILSEIQLKGFESEFHLSYRGEDLGKFRLPTPPGIHNVRNAAAAAAVALYLNIPVDLIREGLEKFTGVGRRFDVKGVINGITLIDDYGHHPAEIRATLEAARGCNFNRLLVLFQPHRYSRTKHLWDEFCSAFNQTDLLVMTDIYAANEMPIAGVSGETLAQAISAAGHKNVIFRSSMQEGIEYLQHEARPGDAVLTIGAGNVSRALGELAILLGAKVHSYDAHP